jgi:hypothetical protein
MYLISLRDQGRLTRCFALGGRSRVVYLTLEIQEFPEGDPLFGRGV